MRVELAFRPASRPFISFSESALQFAEKLFFDGFRAKNRLQVIESSFAEMLEITTLVPFSANCLADDTKSRFEFFSSLFSR